MSASCPAVPTGPDFLSSLLRSLDCLTLTVSERSFLFLSSPGGLASALVVTAVTLLIVLFGYRLIFGPQPTFGDATASAVKVGVVLALATSWPAVSRVIAGPVINGPAELTAWGGTGAELSERLARVDSGIAALTSWGTGRNDIRAPRTASGELTANEAATVSVADSLAFGGARVSWLMTAIGSLGLLRLLTGVLIGLAPIFAGLLLFDRTRGIFAGWCRALFALIVAGAAVRIVLALEMTILEPWLSEVVRQRQAFLATPTAPTELLAVTLAFGSISAGMIFLIFRACLAVEIPTAKWVSSFAERTPSEAVTSQPNRPAVRTMLEAGRSERALQTLGGIERLDSFRETARLVHCRQSDGGGSGRLSVLAATTPAYRTRGRMNRRTMLATRRDSRA